MGVIINKGKEYNINSINFAQQQFELKNHGVSAQQKALDINGNFKTFIKT